MNLICRPAIPADPVIAKPILLRFELARQTNHMSIFNQLQEVIATTLKVSPDTVTEVTTSDNLAAWDSMGHVNLMIALEQSFDIFLDVEDFPILISVPAIVAYLRDHGIR